MMPEFEAKESSNVAWARYDPDSQTLEIDFKNSKGAKASTYEYKYFPVAAWEAFQSAPSKGRYFATSIRPFYKGVKIPVPGASTLDLK
jgi:hypothetical protein